jgi:hypothetical protein
MVFGARFSLQIIALCAPLAAGDYYISYALSSKQLVVSSERVSISQAITPFRSKKVRFTVDIPNQAPISRDERAFVIQHKEDIAEAMLGFETKVASSQKNDKYQNFNEKIQIKYGPTPIEIVFNDGFVTINAYNE